MKPAISYQNSKMKNRFFIGFLVGFFLFVAINLLAAHLISDVASLLYSAWTTALTISPAQVGLSNSMKSADLLIIAISIRPSYSWIYLSGSVSHPLAEL
jgi:hypothetical protein